MLPLLAAGSTFALCVLLGMALGIWVGHRSGQPLWVLGGLGLGFALGGYSAIRLLQRSLQ
jgi:hypothetical protein